MAALQPSDGSLDRVSPRQRSAPKARGEPFSILEGVGENLKSGPTAHCRIRAAGTQASAMLNLTKAAAASSRCSNRWAGPGPRCRSCFGRLGTMDQGRPAARRFREAFRPFQKLIALPGRIGNDRCRRCVPSIPRDPPPQGDRAGAPAKTGLPSERHARRGVGAESQGSPIASAPSPTRFPLSARGPRAAPAGRGPLHRGAGTGGRFGRWEAGHGQGQWQA